MYADILMTKGGKCFPALHVQQGDVFSLLSLSFNAIPVNLPYIVDCAAFSGEKTSLSGWTKHEFICPCFLRGKWKFRRGKKTKVLAILVFFGLSKPLDEEFMCLELQSVSGHLDHA